MSLTSNGVETGAQRCCLASPGSHSLQYRKQQVWEARGLVAESVLWLWAPLPFCLSCAWWPPPFIPPPTSHPQAKKSGFYFPHVICLCHISWFTYHIKKEVGSVCFECFSSAFPERGSVLMSAVRQMLHLFHCLLHGHSGKC